MNKLLIGMLTILCCFTLIACNRTTTVEEPISSGVLQETGSESGTTPVGTQLVIDDLVGVTVYAYYLEKDIELPSWSGISSQEYSYFGAYLNIENLSQAPIDEVVFGSRRPETIISVMPDFYVQTPTARMALNGRFFGDGGTFDDFEQNEMYLMAGAATDNCYVGYDISYSMFDELDLSIEECFLVAVHDGQEYMLEISGAERLDEEK